MPKVTVRQRQFAGIACVAVYDDICAAASLPRLLRITVEYVDVTPRFSMTTESIRTTMSGSAEVDASSSTHHQRSGARAAGGTGRSGFLASRVGVSSGTSGGVIWDAGGNVVADLDVCRSTVTLTHVTAEPDPLDHQKVLRCVANAQQASLSAAASAELDIECKFSMMIPHSFLFVFTFVMFT